MRQGYEFFSEFARIFNSGQARSVVLSGNIYDLFWDGERYVPLIPFLCTKSRTDGLTNAWDFGSRRGIDVGADFR